jgi:hypothetical protein
MRYLGVTVRILDITHLYKFCGFHGDNYEELTGWALQRRGNVFPVRYDLGFDIPGEGIFHSHRPENFKSHIAPTGWAPQRRRNVSPTRHKLGPRMSSSGI